jgi:hypothetical protein
MRDELRGMRIVARFAVLAYLMIVGIILGVIVAYHLLIKKWPANSTM